MHEVMANISRYEDREVSGEEMMLKAGLERKVGVSHECVRKRDF